MKNFITFFFALLLSGFAFAGSGKPIGVKNEAIYIVAPAPKHTPLQKLKQLIASTSQHPQSTTMDTEDLVALLGVISSGLGVLLLLVTPTLGVLLALAGVIMGIIAITKKRKLGWIALGIGCIPLIIVAIGVALLL